MKKGTARVVFKGKKPPESGIMKGKKPAETLFQKLLKKWPPKV